MLNKHNHFLPVLDENSKHGTVNRTFSSLRMIRCFGGPRAGGLFDKVLVNTSGYMSRYFLLSLSAFKGEIGELSDFVPLGDSKVKTEIFCTSKIGCLGDLSVVNLYVGGRSGFSRDSGLSVALVGNRALNCVSCCSG